jgi:hypothetical protein
MYAPKLSFDCSSVPPVLHCRGSVTIKALCDAAMCSSALTTELRALPPSAQIEASGNGSHHQKPTIGEVKLCAFFW